MEAEIKTTCLHDRHCALGAQMSPFAGYDMPIEYEGLDAGPAVACSTFRTWAKSMSRVLRHSNLSITYSPAMYRPCTTASASTA